MTDVTRKEFLEGVGNILGLILVLAGLGFFFVLSVLTIINLKSDGWIILGLLALILLTSGTIFGFIGHFKASRIYQADTEAQDRSMRLFVLQDFRSFLNVMMKINVIFLAIMEIFCFLSICFQMASPLMTGIVIFTIVPLLFVAIFCHLSAIYNKSKSSLSVITVIYTFLLFAATLSMTTNEFRLTWLSACSILYVYVYWFVLICTLYCREMGEAANAANPDDAISRLD